jgi:hypothetical protein
MISFMKGLFGDDMQTGMLAIDSMVKTIDSLRPMMQSIGAMIKPLIDWISKLIQDLTRIGPEAYFGKIWNDVGKSIGDGIKESIGGALSPAGLFGFGKGKETSMNGNSLIQETMAQTDILERIYAKNPTAIFA